jgi:hypothetical protein
MVPATITKVDASMIFVQPPQGLRPRVISIRKAERMGLYDARVGESVMLIVDEGDVMVDVHRMTPPPQGHRLLEGMLDYADPYWGTIRVATPEGKETYAMDSLAASKLSAMHDHTAVRLELDEDNMVIDIHPTH